MARSRAPIALLPAESCAEQLLAALGRPDGIDFDPSCGDVVVVVAPRAAHQLSVDGETLPPGRRVLLGGERLRIGRARAVLGRPAPSSVPPGSTRSIARRALRAGPAAALWPGPVLVIREGPAAGRRWPLSAGRHTIGRGLDADVVLLDCTVSRRHAVIELDENRGAKLHDLGSRHGVRVGRRRVRAALELSDGDVLTLAGARLVYQSGLPTRPPRASLPQGWPLALAAGLLAAGGLASATALFF